MKMALKKRILAALTLCLMLNISTANAQEVRSQWDYIKLAATDSDSERNVLKIIHGRQALTFLCISKTVYMISYDLISVGEGIPASFRELYIHDLTLLMAADDNEMTAMEVTANSPVELGEEIVVFRFVSLNDPDLIQQAINAKSGIVVELKIRVKGGGTARLLKETFPVDGLSEAGKQFNEGCQSME